MVLFVLIVVFCMKTILYGNIFIWMKGEIGRL